MHTQDPWSKLAHASERRKHMMHTRKTLWHIQNSHTSFERASAAALRHRVNAVCLLSFQSRTCHFSALPAPYLHPTRGRQPLPAVPACTAPDSGCKSQWPMRRPLVACQSLLTGSLPASPHRNPENNSCRLKRCKEFLNPALVINILLVINSLFILCFTIPFG